MLTEHDTKENTMDSMGKLKALDREARLLAHIGAVLSWDQETYMPEGALEERSEQMAWILAAAHDKASAPEIGLLLEELGSTSARPGGPQSLPELDRAYLRVLRRGYDKATKIPTELVSEMAKATSLSQAAWVEARKANDFQAFAPHLSGMLEFTKKVAACLDPSKKPYDVILDQYEEGATEAQVASVFGALRVDLVKLLEKIRGRPQVNDDFLHRACPVAAQTKASEHFMQALSYDLTRGRLDTTAHPFTSSLGASDIRITTRYLENFFPSSVFGTMHETGHALYEQGIDPAPEYRGTSLADASSMAIHESQSRLWENMVGRSNGFWLKHLPRLQQLFAPALDGVSPDGFYRGINKVESSLIRVEADEVTYALHIILRFELEGKLMSGALAVADLPAAWNEGMQRLLGVVPTDDAKGCLQDVHWSVGLFGYFPSYALGNLYGAQFWDAMKAQGLDPKAAVERGDLGSILGWLRANVHKPGAAYNPGELVERVTGAPLDASHFVRYLNEKYAGIYGF